MNRILRMIDLGRMDYLEALNLQERAVEKKTREPSDDLLLLVEHPHVFTMGRRDTRGHALATGEVPLYPTSRGGDITYHGPGQLVAYPIIDLRSKLRRNVHLYLQNLEEIVIGTLASFGLHAERKPPWTGVWIDGRKICAIGIAVRRGITYHGAALNVATDLGYFEKIIPCGLGWARITSMDRELGASVTVREVKECFVLHFSKKFGYGSTIDEAGEDLATLCSGTTLRSTA